MRLSALRRSRHQQTDGLSGTARLDRRTRSLLKRLKPGDIAVIDHVDIDRASAVGLVEAGVSAVVNVAPSISGRYPNLGPQFLTRSGVLLIDDVDPEIFVAVNDGATIRILDDTIFVADEAVATGTVQTETRVAEAMKVAEAGMADQLAAFNANAIEQLRREPDLFLTGEGVPRLSTRIDGRPALVVVAAFDYRQELASLKTYIRENSPVLIGVGAGADALLAAGHRPDVVIGDLAEVSDAALRSGAEIVGHDSGDARAHGLERLERLGVSHVPFQTGASAEDAAVLLAHTQGAELIVVAGAHTTLLEFLDTGRSGMASSFLTRAAVGSKVVGAKAVAELYRHRIRGWLVLLLVLLAVGMVCAAIATTPVGQDWWQQLTDAGDDGWRWLGDRF